MDNKRTAKTATYWFTRILLAVLFAGFLIYIYVIATLISHYASIRHNHHPVPPSKWVVTADNSVISTPLLNQGNVYAASLNGLVYAIQGTTGHVLWRTPMASSIVTQPVVTKDGNILAGTADSGDLGCLSAKTGAVIWKTRLPKGITAGPVAGADGTVYAVADHLYALDPAKGKIKWKTKTAFNVSPFAGYAVDVISHSDKTLVVADKVYAFAINSGTLLWTCGGADGKAFTTAAVVSDTTASSWVFVAGANSISCIDVSKGSVVWTSPLPEANYGAPVFDGQNTVYIVSRSGQLTAFDYKTGKSQWSAVCASSVSSDLTLDPSRGLLYFGDEEDRMHVYSISKRADIDTYSLSGNSLFYATSKETSTPVIAGDGTIILGSDDGSIYALNQRIHLH